jgi:hypothetical protein
VYPAMPAATTILEKRMMFQDRLSCRCKRFVIRQLWNLGVDVVLSAPSLFV